MTENNPDQSMTKEKALTYISKEEAFKSIKDQLAKGVVFQDENAPYDLSFLVGLSNWNDQAGNDFQARPPEILNGQQVMSRLINKYTKEQVVRGDSSDISTDGMYWAFVWIKPGVEDESYSFYVNAKDGTFLLISRYISPY